MKKHSGKQISGIEPNYSYKGVQNLPFDQSSISSSGHESRAGLISSIEAQRNFVEANNNFTPLSTFDTYPVHGSNSAHLENLNSHSQYNINKTFEQNKPIQFMPDTKNKHNTLYDNLNDNLLKESLKEYRLNIDSIDRNVELYPDPFNYVIHLGPVTNSGINSSVSRTTLKSELKALNKKSNRPKTLELHQAIQTQTDYVESPEFRDIFIFSNPDAIKEYTVKLEKSVNPYIIRDFQNVSYVRLDCAVVPKFSSICINTGWDYCRKHNYKKTIIRDEFERMKNYSILNQRYIPNEMNDYNPLGDRFIQIFITELQSIRNFGTNPITDKSFLLIYDKTLGALYLKLIPYSAFKSYKESLLGNLTKLSVQFYDSWGNPLKIDTKQIDVEKNQLLNTKILNPSKCDFEQIINYLETKTELPIEFIKNFNEIVKCFIIINSNIEKQIPFYSNVEVEGKECFNVHCECLDVLRLNDKVFDLDDFMDELNMFVSMKKSTGFVERIKKVKNGKKVRIGIDEFLNHTIWFDLQVSEKQNILHNMKVLYDNYVSFGYDILDELKTEIVNIPVNKNFQNFLTFLVGIWENELNTKIEYSN